MRRILALSVLALLAAGCGGPELIVKPLDGEAKARVYFKPLEDREGSDLSKQGRESDIGDMPTEWEVPEALLGGKGQARVVFDDGSVRLVEYFAIFKDKDTIIRVTRPPKAPKAR